MLVRVLLGIFISLACLDAKAVDCMQPRDSYELAVDNIYQFCFKQGIVKIKNGDSTARLTLESGEDLPASYRKAGIVSILNFLPMKEGIFSNFYVDTADGKRHKYAYKTVSNTLFKTHYKTFSEDPPAAKSKKVGKAFNRGLDIFTNGYADVPSCNICHGEDANGDDAMGTPKLAGLSETYLLAQFNNFRSGRRTDTTMYTMNTNMKELPPDKYQSLAAYLSSLDSGDVDFDRELLTRLYAGFGHAPIGTTREGKQLFNGQTAKNGLRVCVECHHPEKQNLAPRIHKQRFVYLVKQLKDMRSGSRKTDIQGKPHSGFTKLTDREIASIAEYLATHK